MGSWGEPWGTLFGGVSGVSGRGLGRGFLLLGSLCVWKLRGRPFWEGQGEGSWEGKNQRKSMAGALFLSLRVRAGKGVWSGRGARKACPGHSFVKILSPKDPPKKEARGGFQKWSGGWGSGEGGAGGGAQGTGMEGIGSDAVVHEWL